MKFKKLDQLLREIDPAHTDRPLTEKEARALLFHHYPDPSVLSAKQAKFFSLLAEAQSEYTSRKVDLLCDPATAKKRAQLEIGNEEREHFLVMLLNTKNGLMDTKILFSGTIDRAAVFPREVVRYALLKGARSMIVAHNHPSQDVEPSNEDLYLTERIIKASVLLDINVHDHLIVSSERALSLRETHPHLWMAS
ncbi:MAG: hypothetical protein KDC71_22750 [Acidobacteria bacterium]|nr:hypothetical protein [Acidobacteriota bacterium]